MKKIINNRLWTSGSMIGLGLVSSIYGRKIIRRISKKALLFVLLLNAITNDDINIHPFVGGEINGLRLKTKILNKYGKGKGVY